jgi:hypothetical protein
MKRKAIVSILGILIMLAGVGSRSYADEMLGGEPKEFSVAILSEDHVSFVVPSVIIVDEKQRQNPLELVVSNHTKKEHGFAIDKFRVKEVLKPGETKKIKISVTDMDSIGTDRSAFRMYDHLHPQEVSGQIYIKR